MNTITQLDPIYVDSAPEPEQPFSVDTTSSAVPPPSSPETMEARAFKFKYGLDEVLKKTKDEIYGELQNGGEPNLRDMSASAIDERKMLATQKAVTDLEARKGSPLSLKETSGIVEMINNLNQKTDPKSVLEEAYGKQFIATLDRVAAQKPDSFLNDAKQKYPEEVAQMFNEKSDLVTKRTYAETAAHNIKDEIKSSGWLPWTADLLKTMVPGYEDVKLRANVKGVGVFTGGGLGQNLEEQRKVLLRKPFDDFKTEFDSIVENLKKDNPMVAAEFADNVVGMSTNDVMLKTSTLPTSLIGTGIVSGVSKAGYRAFRGIKNVAKSDQVLKDTLKATEDMARAAAEPNVSKSTLEAAAGDLQEAAVTRATTNVIGDMTNASEPTKRAVEGLATTFRTDLDEIAAGPGRLGQDIVNRIEESSNTVTQNLFKTIQDLIKVERLPDVMATETGVRAVVESVKNRYTSLKNIVIDTSRPYKEPVSNTYLVDMHLGKTDGTYFENRGVAENYKKWLGLEDAQIIEGKNAAFTKDAVKTAQLNKNIKDAEDAIVKIEARQKENKYSSPTKAERDKETLEFLRNEAIPNFKSEIEGLRPSSETSIKVNGVERPDLYPQKASVEQQGLGFYIKVTKPVDETSPIIRQLIATTKNTKLPDSPVNRFLNGITQVGKLRTSEDVLSLAERQAREAVTYAPSKYFEILIQNSPALQRISSSPFARFSKGRKRWDEFVKVLENAQELPDATDATKKGYFFKSPEEMETYYQQWVHRLPDADEVTAYFEFKRGMEIDRVFRNIAEHRNQQRVGAETHKVFSTNEAGERIASAEFSGVVRPKIPGAQDTVLVISGKHGEERALDLSRMSTKEKGEWQASLDRGEYKLVELYNPELRPLNGYGNIKDLRVRYVLAKEMESRELDWNHITRRGGGHIQYDYDFYIKQPKISYDKVGGRYWYEGDTTLMAVQIQKVGQDAAKHLNEVRKLLKSKDEGAARDYSNENLHIDWETVKGWFTAGKDEAGNYRGAQLSLDHDIQLVRRGDKIINVDKNLERNPIFEGNLRNGTKEGSLARQAQVEFNQERDAFEMLALEDKGTRGNPLYGISPAKVIDPVTVLNRGLTRIARSNFMDDYKTMSVEHWLKQAGEFLDARDSEIRHSPMYYFNEGKWKPGADANITARLDSAKFHIQQLVGQPSDLDTQLHSYTQKMVDMIYGSFGGKTATVTQEWALSTLKDPFQFMRSVVFNAKLGLFNVPQFIVQAGNYSNILGIAGYRYAAPGTLGAQLHFWSSVNSNPAIIKHLDEMASKFSLPGTSSFKPGEFEEAFHLLNRTGFGNAGGEYAALDAPLSQKIVKSAGLQFLDWGQFFFKQGERNARYGAWYTAYKEFRDAKPLGRVTDEDLASILQRADLLNINMSRASSSALHTGAMGVVNQFNTYQIRLTELMVSKRLTPQEKGRLFATNALLYGIPMAGGLTGFPVADYIRKKAMSGEYGTPYVVGDNFFSSAAMEGVLSSIGAVVTGKGDPAGGTWFDFGPRLGTKGFEFFGGSGNAKKGWLDTIPVYSLVKETVAASDGFGRAMLDMAKGEGEVFPFVVEDLADVAKEVSSFNTAFAPLAAIHSGRAISKKEAYLADTTGAQAIFRAITGLKDQSINDIQTLTSALKDQKDYEQLIEERFRQEFRRGVMAHKDDNPELGKKFFTRAARFLDLGGYPEDRINSLLNKAINDNESVLSKVRFDYYIKKAPDALRTDRMKAMQKNMLIQDRQNGE